MLFFYSVSEIEQNIETSLRTEPTTVDAAVGHLFVRLVGDTLYFRIFFAVFFFFFSVSIINRKMYLCRSKEEEDSDAGEAVEEEEEEAASQHDLASWQLSCGMLQQTDRQTKRQRDGQTEENPLVNHLLNLVAQRLKPTQPNRTEPLPGPTHLTRQLSGVGVVLPDFAVTLKNLWNLFSLILSFLFDKKES